RPTNCCTVVWSTRLDHRYSLTGRTNRWSAFGSSSGAGGRSRVIPRRTKSNVEKSAPASVGSLIDAVHAPGHVRCTTSWIVSTPGNSQLDASCHVVGEFVIT